MITLDFNQTIIAATSQAQTHMPNEVNVDTVRGLFLSSLKNYRQTFSYDYGELVICCDARRSWRKDVFPYYKASRSAGRESTKQYVNWDVAFEAMGTIAQELDESFPYRVIQVEGAEGDDIIATLCLYLYHNEDTHIERGVLTEPERVLILSSDNDFKQLQILGNVDQWSYRTGKWIVENRPDLYLQRKILQGDRKDGVPNVLSDDDVFVTEKRQKPLKETKITTLLETDSVDSYDDVIKRNYQRNQQLLDLLHCIPQTLQDQIIDAYHNAHVEPKANLLTYFMRHQLKQLASDIQIF